MDWFYSPRMCHHSVCLSPWVGCELLDGRGLILLICLSPVPDTVPDTWWIHSVYLLNLEDLNQSPGRLGSSGPYI